MESTIIKQAIESIKIQADAVANLANHLQEEFDSIIRLLYESKGRIIITGIGKSAIIAQKITATLNSTGTPAIFMHAADAIHGDLGIIQPDDVVLCLSKSGNTPEIKVLVPLIRNLGNKVIGMVADKQSYLAKHADFVLYTPISREACPNNLAPTSSTTVQLVMGDAVAVCLLSLRGFSEMDFARVHPGGSLGKKLYMRVSDIYLNNESPRVLSSENIRNIILEISTKRLGATAVTTEDGRLLGIITDGDIRRMLERNQPMDQLKASDIMSTKPKTIHPDEMAVNAFHIMESNSITQLLVVEEGIYKGIIHLHDLLKEGIV
ncbi:MAG: KpsF/GutQ family sugar-phosphate isomerase [Bacteroidales bacterium]|nr:KpsF/GutQ family sugar-phosphate isomerase [Bacteroidales bacterium]